MSCLYLGGFNITKDIDHTVLRDYVTIAKIDQIFLRQVLHSFDRAVRTQRVWVLWKKRLSHDVARDAGQLFFLLLDRGDLDLFFTRDSLSPGTWH